VEFGSLCWDLSLPCLVSGVSVKRET
jgi:hypothetical protein